MNYKVYQGTELKQTVTSKIAVMNGLQPNQTYEFGIQPNNGKRDGTKVTKSVTTRGIRFNIPKTLTVGSTIALRYEEYPLGIVPIGNEPSGYFGGGNKQNLSAKVISTANGSSVVEVSGNVIDVGNKNYLVNSSNFSNAKHWIGNGGTTLSAQDGCLSVFKNDTGEWRGVDQIFKISPNDLGKTFTATTVVKNASDSTAKDLHAILHFLDSNNDHFKQTSLRRPDLTLSSDFQTFEFTADVPNDSRIAGINLIFLTSDNESVYHVLHKSFKFEQGAIATPYASFVDGDTFTAQPDGTCALFSEYKALYY